MLSSAIDCSFCVTSLALSKILQRATTLSRMVWSTFSPSAKGRHYCTRITEPVDYYVASSNTLHLICRKRTFGQIDRQDGFRHDTQVAGEFTEKNTVDAHTYGIIKDPKTSYHPQSNGMVKRFHRQLKAAIIAHESPNPWTITLPAVILCI